MKIAIISDIHSNLEALESVLSYCVNNHINKIVSLGDVVGYGPNPNECVKLVEEQIDLKIMGNHDHAIIGLTPKKRFSQIAYQAIEWTDDHLQNENRKRIERYQITGRYEQFKFVHSSLSEPLNWSYIVSEIDAKNEISGFNEVSVCFLGHTHIPAIYSAKNGYLKQSYCEINESESYIINVGSVGQPRDGDIRASFGVLDNEQMDFHHIRVDYPFKKTINKITKSTLPTVLGYRLSIGR